MLSGTVADRDWISNSVNINPNNIITTTVTGQRTEDVTVIGSD